jgi:hypothetical protein
MAPLTHRQVAPRQASPAVSVSAVSSVVGASSVMSAASAAGSLTIDSASVAGLASPPDSGAGRAASFASPAAVAAS